MLTAHAFRPLYGHNVASDEQFMQLQEHWLQYLALMTCLRERELLRNDWRNGKVQSSSELLASC